MTEDDKNLERMATDDSGVQGPNADNSPPWLNSIEAAGAIVRKFAADILKRYGQAEQQAFMGWVTHECFQLNEVFIGAGLESRPYARGPWNTPDQLGHHLALALHIDGELRFAVRDAFMIFASKVAALMREHQTEASLPALQRALDAAVAEMTNQLLGLDEVPA